MLSLLAPWFLAGLAALAVPVLVHLTHKERKEPVIFPSLMFLDRVPYQAVSRQRLRHLLLFAMRCLAILMIVFAFARPFFARRDQTAGVALAGRDIVFLLDRSYSMEYGDRWRQAVTAVKGAIDTMGGGDRGMVIYFAGTAWRGGALTGDKSALRAAIDSVRPTAGATRYDACFRLAARVLRDTVRPRPEVVLVSDFQRSGWGERELPPLPEGTTLTLIDVGSSSTANAAVTGVDARYDSSVARERVIVAARIENRSQLATLRSATLEVNGREMQTKPVDIPANGVAKVEFAAVPIREGSSRATVRTSTDSLERDNRFHFVLKRRASLPVLMVQSLNAGAGAGLFLSRALAIGNDPSFRVIPVTTAQLSANSLRNTALVILNDVPMPDGDLGRQIVNYVKEGGGLMVVFGQRSESDRWPALANELLPRSDGVPVDHADDRGIRLGFVDRGHVVFDAFDSPRSGDFSAATFFRYANVQPGPNDRELARFGDGKVALLERRVGSGRVLVWSSDLDGAWNDLPLHPVFLPLVHQAAKYAAGYEAERAWSVVGQVVSPSTLFGDSTQHRYVAIAPTRAQIRLGASGGPAALDLTEQGFYDIKPTTGRADSAHTIAVNVDLAESDLTPLDTALFRTAVAPRATPDRDASTTGALTSADAERRQNVWWYLLLASAILLAAETLLSNKLSRSAVLERH